MAVWCGATFARADTAEPFPATAELATSVLNNTRYVDSLTFFERYGLARSWQVPGRKAQFARGALNFELEADKAEIRANGVRLFLGDPVLFHRNGLWISRLDAEKVFGPLLRPGLYGAQARVPRVIVVDAGHGGKDAGATNNRLKLLEKEIALDVAKRVAAMLEREGFSVVMTRTDDRFIPLAERAEIAKQAKADLFVSIHFNSAVPEVRGTETYVLTPRHQRSTGASKTEASDHQEQLGNASDPWNLLIGYQVHRQLLSRLETFDRGLKRARFAVLRLIDCPGVLVEAGYVSNDEEGQRLAAPKMRVAVAEAVVNGVLAYAAQVEAAKP